MLLCSTEISSVKKENVLRFVDFYKESLKVYNKDILIIKLALANQQIILKHSLFATTFILTYKDCFKYWQSCQFQHLQLKVLFH